MLSPVRIEAHAYGRGTPFDLTRYVKSVSWSEGTTAPWDWISAELALPLGDLLTSELRVSGDPGDPYWLRAPSPREDEAGQVERAEVFQKTKDGVSIDPGLWLKVIENATGRMLAFGRINDSPGSLSGPQGALYASASVQADGALQFIRTLPTEVAVGLSESVGGIMNADRWSQYLKVITRIIKRADFGLVFGPGGLLSFLGPVRIPPTLIPGATTLADLFLPAYTVDTGRVVAPLRTMDPVPVAGATAIASALPNGTVADVVMGTFQREPRLIEMFPSIEGATNDPTAKGYADARPVMIHRLIPWRTGRLSEMVVTHEGEPAAVSIDERFEAKTWDLGRALKLRKDEVFRFSHRRTDAARINAVTVNWTVMGGQPIRLMSWAGLPLFDRKDVELHGAKMLELNWDMAPDQLGDFELAKRLRTIGLLGWNLYGLGHVFRVGSFECGYLGLRARAGEPVQLDIGRDQPFTAYMTRVTHTVTVQARGAQSGRTVVEYDRGLFEERYRDPLVFQAKKPPATTKAKPVEQVKVVCAEGAATTFPLGMSLDLSKVPTWLDSWAVGRGFNRGDLTGSKRANVLVVAAVAYVIEAYWRQLYADAVIDPIAVLRANDASVNHRLGCALDFAVKVKPNAPAGQIKTAGVLQTWAALTRLGNEGRIPKGGRGLYLNFEAGGISGTTPDQAGKPSRPYRKTGPPSARFPAGGSTGVHYDYRGAFGFVSSGSGTDPTTWIAADTDGDGRDEYTLTETDRTILTDFLPANSPAILAYFLNGGAFDPSLPAVGPTVPNVMQVLGQVQSCFLRGP